MVRSEYLARGSLMRIEDARGYFVPAGKSFRVSRDGLTVISAIRRSSITTMKQSAKEAIHATESAAS